MAIHALKRERLAAAEECLQRSQIILPERELIVAFPEQEVAGFQNAEAKGNRALLSVMAGANDRKSLATPERIAFTGIPAKSVQAIAVPTYTASTDPALAASIALQRPLNGKQAAAVMTAHLVGLGDLGKDRKHFACVGNFTKEHIVEKARVLAEARFSVDEIDVLVRTGIVGGSAADAAHYAICTDLFNGRVVDAHPFHANGNHTEIYWTKIYNDHTGREREALFKPRLPGDCNGYGRNTMEYVAYALNRMLQMDLVPPVAYRHHLDLAYQRFHEGALIYMVPDAHLLKYVAHHEWGHNVELFLSDARILDLLIQNPDRNQAGYIRGRHWVDGSYRPMLIDHGAGMRANTYITLEQGDAMGGSTIHRIRRRTYDALKSLHFDWLRDQIGEFVSHDEIHFMLHIRDEIVRYFEHRAHEHGWENVVVG